MFLSHKYMGYLGYNEKTHQHRHRYKIIDSDFETEGIIAASGEGLGIEFDIEFAIIPEYSKRNLNVAANFVRAIQYDSKKYGPGGHSIAKLVEYNRKFNPEFHKYEKELEKYLCLI